MGPLQKLNEFRQIEEKGTPWQLLNVKNRLTGIPKESRTKSMKSAATPLVPTPFVPFRLGPAGSGRRADLDLRTDLRAGKSVWRSRPKNS